MKIKKWFSLTPKSFLFNPAFLVLLGVCLVTATILGWRLYVNAMQERLAETTAAKADSYTAEIAYRFHTVYHALERLTQDGHQGAPTDEEGWQAEAVFYWELFDALTLVALVSEEQDVLLTLPADDPRAVPGRSVSQIVPESAEIPLWLPVQGGGPGQADRLFALVSLDKLIAPLIRDLDQDFLLQITDGADLSYAVGAWPPPIESLTASEIVTLDDGTTLTLRIAPGQTLLDALHAEARIAIWFGGGFSLMTVIAVYFAQKSTLGLFSNRLRYQGLFQASKDAVFLLDLQGNVLEVNPASSDLVGYPQEDLCRMNIRDLIADPAFTMASFEYFLGYDGVGWEELRHQDGHIVTVEITLSLLKNKNQTEGVLGIARDISERKRTEDQVQLRLNLVEMAPHSSVEQVLQKALDEICGLTDSPIGFFHFVESDGETLSSQVWSTRTRAEFCQAEGTEMHYPIAQAGVWVDCIHEHKPVIHNDYAALPHRKGLPEGHVEVVRELVVPIMRAERVVAILGVGNKPRDYTQDDLDRVAYLADVCWEVIDKKRIESERLEQFNLLEVMFNHLPLMVLLVDEEWRIQRTSQHTANILKRPLGAFVGTRCGEGLRCLNALDDPQGCGFGPNCKNCCLRNTVLDTITSGEAHQGVPVSLPMDMDGQEKDAHFLLSSTPLSINASKKALVSLMDVTEQAQGAERTQLLLRQQTTLNQLAMDIALKNDPGNLCQTLFTHLHGLIDLDTFSVYTYEPQSELAARVFHAENGSADHDQAAQPINFRQAPESCLFKVIRSDAAHYNPQAVDDGAAYTCLCAPMLAMGDVVGILRLESRQENAYSQETQDLVGAIANFAGTAWQNAQLIQTLEDTVRERTVELEEKIRKLNRSQKAMLFMVEDLNQTSAALKAEREKLVEANEELEAFSYSVSHDLRAPLRYIRGYIDLVLRRFPDALPDKGRHYLDSIDQAAGEMDLMIDSLLLFSKTSRQEMHPTRVDMGEIVQEARINLRPDHAERKIDWQIDPLPVVHGDRYLLKLIWNNLLSNALKYTSHRTQAHIEVGCDSQGDAWHFFVRDNGVGFDMKYSHKLFSVFQRLHSSAEFEGIGIGLANLRRIVQRHGGRTWAEGEPGHGATFYFSLPK